MTDSEIIRGLRERIEELEEEIRQLRADMVQTDATFMGVLTRQQIALLNGIYNRKVANYQYIDQVMAANGNFNRCDAKDLEKPRSKVAIHNLRKRLKPHGIEIKTWRGVGYYLDDENKAKLKQLMEKKNG
jgi:DNA-binding response OmpR family regulator